MPSTAAQIRSCSPFAEACGIGSAPFSVPRGFGPGAGARAAEVAAGPWAVEVAAGPGAVWKWLLGSGLCGEIGTANPAFAVPNQFYELNRTADSRFPYGAPAGGRGGVPGGGSIDQRVWARAEGGYKSFDFLVAFFCILHSAGPPSYEMTLCLFENMSVRQ